MPLPLAPLLLAGGSILGGALSGRNRKTTTETILSPSQGALQADLGVKLQQNLANPRRRGRTPSPRFDSP